MTDVRSLTERWLAHFNELGREPTQFTNWLRSEIAAADGGHPAVDSAAALRALAMFEFSSVERKTLLAAVEASLAAPPEFDFSGHPRLATLQAEYERLQAEAAQRDLGAAETARLRQQRAALEAELARLQRELAELRKCLSETADATKGVAADA